MSAFEDRLKSELSALGFNWDDHKIRNTFSQKDKSMSTATFDIPMKHVNKNGEIVDGILIFEFTVSQKESQEKPLIDRMVTTLAIGSFSTENPPILMRQIFHTDVGDLPSRRCLLQRAYDCLSSAKMKLDTGASLKERLHTEFANLGYDFEKLEIFLPTGKTYFKDTLSLEHISGQNDQLVTMFHMSPNIDQNAPLIEGMIASLNRTTTQESICLMSELHYTKFETLPSKNQLYNRAVEMLRTLKIQEKFAITNDRRDLKNTQNKSNQIKRNRYHK